MRAPARRGDLAGHGMGLFTAFSFGSAYPVGKPLVAALDPLAFACFRYLVAALLMLAIVRMFGPFRTRLADLPVLLLLGLLGFTLFQGAWGFALDLTTASKGAVLIATSPIFGALISFAGGERLRPLGWAGVLLAFAGVYVVVNDGIVLRDPGGSLGGDLLFIAIAALWAVYGAASRPVMARLGAAETASVAAMLGALMLLPLVLWRGGLESWGTLDAPLWIAFAWIVLIPGCLGNLTWNGGLARLGLTRIIVYLYVSPVFAVAIAGVLLGERMSLAQLAGAAAVLAGVAVTQTLGRPRAT